MSASSDSLKWILPKFCEISPSAPTPVDNSIEMQTNVILRWIFIPARIQLAKAVHKADNKIIIWVVSCKNNVPLLLQDIESIQNIKLFRQRLLWSG